MSFRALQRALIAGAVLAASLGIVVVVNGAPALASGCVGASCTGKNPTNQGCSGDARTVASFVAHPQSNIEDHVYVEVRHSNTCKAKWLRMTTTYSKWGCGGGAPEQVRLRDLTSSVTVISEVHKTYSPCTGGAVITNMVGRTSNSYEVGFCWREGPVGGGYTGQWGTDSYYYPCKKVTWTASDPVIG